MVAESTDSTLQWARAALARGDRDAARKHFTIALELEETPEALEGLAQAGRVAGRRNRHLRRSRAGVSSLPEEGR